MRRTIYRIFFFLLLGGVLTGCQTRELAVREAWARPGIQGGNSAVYFQINNPTAEDDLLLSAQSSAARRVELHRSVMDSQGTMSMQPQPSVEVLANTQVDFEPGGLHVMLVELTRDLRPGDTIPIVLTFQNAGETSLDVPVREP